MGFVANSNWPTYTATIKVPGSAPRTVTGKAHVSGGFSTQAGAKTSISVTFTSTTYTGQITGSVVDSAGQTPLGGICVKAYDTGGGVLASAQTNASGTYTLTGLPTGSDRVGFFSGCGAANYLTQYFNGRASLAGADPISVTDGATTPGINAAMLPGGQITGTATDSATHAPIAGICVQAYDTAGAVAASAQTSATGVYTLSALPTGSDRVGFVDCSANAYVAQYYNGKASLATADPVAITAGATTTGISPALVRKGGITGTVTDSATHAPIAGICVNAYYTSGNSPGSALTDAVGHYSIPTLDAGSYRVEFVNCGASTYLTQWYKARATGASADPVTVTDGTTTSGIDAAMVQGGQITGTVTDSTTHAPLPGICAEALDSSGNAVTAAGTDATGHYTLTNLQTGSYHVEFYSQCGVMDYVTQYYSGKGTLASADPVAVTAASTTSGIDAAMVKGGEITGTVTDGATHAPIWGICVDALDSNGNDVAAGYTDRTGAYTIYGAPPGGARVEFYSQPSSYSNPSCGGTNYVTQYYNEKPSLALADPVTVAPGGTTGGINAAMAAG